MILEMSAENLVSMVHLVFGKLTIMIGGKMAKTESLVVKDGNVHHFSTALTKEGEAMILNWKGLNTRTSKN